MDSQQIIEVLAAQPRNLPVSLISEGNVTDVKLLDRLNPETKELEYAFVIFGSDDPSAWFGSAWDELIKIVDEISAWQKDDEQVTGIDLLLSIKKRLEDIVSLGDTQHVE